MRRKKSKFLFYLKDVLLAGFIIYVILMGLAALTDGPADDYRLDDDGRDLKHITETPSQSG